MHPMRILLPVLLASAPALANVPAAFFACEGLSEGDACERPAKLKGGRCVRDTLCDTDVIEDVDECLLCHDACYGQAPDTACVQATGEPGVCRVLDPEICTDPPETSFAECNRCSPGDVEKTDPDEGGCASVGGHAVALLAWLLVLGAGLLQLRRRDP